MGRLADLLEPGALVVLRQAVLAAVGHLARVALSDDVDRRLAAPLGRVEHRPAPLLAPAPEAEREVDRVARGKAVGGERARLELVGAKDEALLRGGDRGAVGDGEGELGDGRGGCEVAQGQSHCHGVARRATGANVLNESERPERSLTKSCMMCGVLSEVLGCCEGGVGCELSAKWSELVRGRGTGRE